MSSFFFRKKSDFTPRVNSGMGFHPIQGVISPQPGMISPPPMIMPTPVNSTGLFSMGGNQMPVGGMTSPLLMQVLVPLIGVQFL